MTPVHIASHIAPSSGLVQAMTRISGSDNRTGMVIDYRGLLRVAVKTMAVKPGKGPVHAQVELKRFLYVRRGE